MLKCSTLLLGLLLCAAGHAGIQPEKISQETMGAPGPTWFLVRSGLGSQYVFDVATGEMHGLLPITFYTPAVEPNLAQNEIYAAEIYYSRVHNGTRTDVVTVYDAETLTSKAEIEVPQKIASLPFRHYIALLDDAQHLAVFNLTPAQSVSIVDVKQRNFVTEISTPGCALNFATPGRAFLQICGDGRLQMIRLDEQGNESQRVRSDRFFNLEEDPVFDKPVRTASGWLLVSYQGDVFEVSVDGDDIEINKPWSLVVEKTEGELAGQPWGPGGGHFLSYHRDLDLLFVLMNTVGEFGQDSAGEEVWVFDVSEQSRIARLALEHKAEFLHVSQNRDALLAVSGEDLNLHIFDVKTLKEVRTIDSVGAAGAGHIQGF